MKKIIIMATAIVTSVLAEAASPIDLACNILRKHEGFSDKVYTLNGIKHIGYGFTSAALVKRQRMTRNEAERELRKILTKDLEYLRTKVRGLTANQEAACLSFIYNVGRANFAKSTFLKNLQQRKVVEASNELDRWIYASGKVCRGLVSRRKAEKALFTA
jgi:lysozyme